MQVLPIVIGNEYCNFPILKNVPVEFRLPTNIGDFQNLTELVDILKDVKNLFHSRFSFMRFTYFLSRKDCKSLNDLEKAILRTISKEQLSSYIRPSTSDDTEVSDLEEIVPIKEIHNLRDSIVSVFYQDTKDAYADIEFQNLSDCTPYDNLYQFFSKYFILHYKVKDLLRMMAIEQSKMNVEYQFSEAEMIKALLLFALFLIKPEDIIKEVPILANIDRIKIALIKEEFPLEESDEEIAQMFANGEFDWFEGELLSRSKNRIIREIKSYITKEYQTITKDIIEKKEEVLKLQSLKSRWGDIKKTRFMGVSFKTNVYNLVFEDKVKPVIYILDETLYSISIGRYAVQFYENSESSQKLDNIVYDTRKELESLLKINYYWAKNQELEIKIFDKNGLVYQEFNTKTEFLENFKANNVSLEKYYNRIEENNKLVKILFAGNQDYSQDDIKAFVGFSKKLYKYLGNNGDKSRLLRFPDLDLKMNSASIVTLFETLLERGNEINKVYPFYYSLIDMFFTILLRVYTQGQRWFKLTGTGFKEDAYLGRLAKVLSDHFGIEKLLKIIISIIKIQTRVVDKSIIKRVYIWKYSFLFDNLEIGVDEIIELIYKLFKELKK